MTATAAHPDPRAPAAPPHLAHWPRRLPRELAIPATPLHVNLQVSAARWPDKAACVFLGRAMSYAELDRDSTAIAAWLAAQGVARGDRVALFMQNCPQFLVAFYGALKASAVVIPRPEARAHATPQAVIDWAREHMAAYKVPRVVEFVDALP